MNKPISFEQLTLNICVKHGHTRIYDSTPELHGKLLVYRLNCPVFGEITITAIKISKSKDFMIYPVFKHTYEVVEISTSFKQICLCPELIGTQFFVHKLRAKILKDKNKNDLLTEDFVQDGLFELSRWAF